MHVVNCLILVNEETDKKSKKIVCRFYKAMMDGRERVVMTYQTLDSKRDICEKKTRIRNDCQRIMTRRCVRETLSTNEQSYEPRTHRLESRISKNFCR